jgi:hypothetical protein
MGGYDYSSALWAAREEMAELVRQREALAVRILQLEKTIQGLTALSAQNDAGLPGRSYRIELAEAILIALRNAGQPMSPVGVRDMLVAMGVNFGRFVNPMSAVHNALQRLRKRRLVVCWEGNLWSVAT